MISTLLVKVQASSPPIMSTIKQAPALLLAFAAGYYVQPYIHIHLAPQTKANAPIIKRRNGLSTDFKPNITTAELDAHCANIEQMRQRLRGLLPRECKRGGSGRVC